MDIRTITEKQIEVLIEKQNDLLNSGNITKYIEVTKILVDLIDIRNRIATITE